MYAVKLDATIPQNRQLLIQVPSEVPIGEAEVIILTNPATQPGNGQMLLRYLHERQLSAELRRSTTEIDAQIEQERTAWE